MGFFAAITNLGEYNAGVLDYKWTYFPCESEAFDKILDEINIGKPDPFGIPYEEWFVSDYEDDEKLGVARELGEYPSFEKLNRAADIYDAFQDADITDLLNLCGDFELDPEVYDLYSYFDSEDEALSEMVKEQADGGGLSRVVFFVRAVALEPMCEGIHLNAYGNLEPVSDMSSVAKDKAVEMFADVLKGPNK